MRWCTHEMKIRGEMCENLEDIQRATGTGKGREGAATRIARLPCATRVAGTWGNTQVFQDEQ